MIGSSHPVVHVWLQALADTALFKKNEYFFSEYSRIKKNQYFMNEYSGFKRNGIWN